MEYSVLIPAVGKYIQESLETEKKMFEGFFFKQ